MEVGLANRKTQDSSSFTISETSVVEQFTYTARNGLGGGKLSALYIPTGTTQHTFYLYGTCIGEFFMSLNTDEAISMDSTQKVRMFLKFY